MNQTKKLINPVKGTRDFYPENWQFQQWFSQKLLSTGRLYGYQEYEAPILEPIELYLGKTSQEIVEQQTFSLTDRGGETLVLRPELTPSVARMVAQKQSQLIFPLRWQSYGRFWRYEKPQRGRGREFFQWNIDIFGSTTVNSDIEMLTLAARALENLGITPSEAKIKINDRQSLDQFLCQQLNTDSTMVKILIRAIDKIDKLTPTDFQSWLAELNFTSAQIAQISQILSQNPQDFSPRLNQIIGLLPANVSAYVEVDLKIVRGFDYYTGLVFEAWANTNLRRSLFGGGRYDNLTQQVGGTQAIAGVGFAIGDMPLYELLLELNKLPQLSAIPTKVLVAPFSADQQALTIALAELLRQNNINTELYPDPAINLGNKFKYANNNQIPYVALIGPDEAKDNLVTVKKLADGSQQTLPFDQIVSFLKKEFLLSSRA